jgi:hypothetical protein
MSVAVAIRPVDKKNTNAASSAHATRGARKHGLMAALSRRYACISASPEADWWEGAETLLPFDLHVNG